MEVQNTKKRMKKMKGVQKKYIAKDDDPIDRALANFLNFYPHPEKLKILFLREQEGVYRFGSRQVIVKIEKGFKMQDQVQMKVGGGFMSAKEFVERYTDYEVLKITRRDVMSRFKDTVKEIKEIKKVTGRRGAS